MTTDPYPDLPGAEPPDAALSGPGGADLRAELSEADARLLDALSRPAAPVVEAVEDRLRGDTGEPDQARGPIPSSRSAALVFQEPAD